MGLKLSHVLGGVLELLGTNSASPRTITFPDKDMTVAGTNDVIGVNQTVQSAELTDTGATFTDGTPSFRSNGVTYTNDSDKAIYVYLRVHLSTTSYTIGTFTMPSMGTASIDNHITFMVPPNTDYSVIVFV